ncbi:oxidoreductase [Elizabethkingia meningoseptica]|uniref:NADP-dependent oxidoreductase n=1 Tax=Elizabethkingia meningoseptica TaxID=238 RepID=UPI000332C6DA|nr:NADP-dependent oxidoreductase [Elizabethkingia meningoseptica]AQX03845.1 oxidoreductase [Elizabethkingia meningoseptica]AQX45884.1 oxidoreductase [Elizabethkingia meningoseptica]EOR28702.1 alcohol dehydrogenase/quinone reductase-like protein, MDR superfamily [Elizabethkingia meningoseptica ATCC 13253 = NBRC 12535]KUY15177.1 oxidoreductase [Elizabethkingia meningoseptica]OPB69452.1 oxidoreductase [Elizabethkingia meningoseptica]
MKAFLLDTAGDVENLYQAEIETPSIKSNEVLVKVASISINPVDVKARRNDGVLSWLFADQRPVILGWDIAGEIAEVGKDVTDFKVGDRVFGMVNFFGTGKAYAEYVAAPADHLALIPSSVSYPEAAATTLAAATAYQALTEAGKIKKGDRVLIHAASGGVGHYAVQIAKHLGANVIGTSSAKNKDFVLSLGADEHVDYTKEDIRDVIKDVDVVLDGIAGETLLNSLDIVKENGTVITLPSADIPEETLEKAAQRNVNLQFFLVDSKKETIRTIAQLLETKALKPHIHQEFSFSEMGKAHAEVETGRVVGKVIVNI